MRKTDFVICGDEKTYEGYTDGRLWNGWECPWFTREVAEEIMQDLNKLGVKTEYDMETDSYIVHQIDDVADKYNGADIKTEDGLMHLYPIGGWCWIWDEVYEEKETTNWAEQLFTDMGKSRGLAIMILDIFEDMLDEKGIMIPDDDRTGNDGEACLYGCTYGDLEEEITALLSKYIKE